MSGDDQKKPESYPESPDLRRVNELRDKIRSDKAEMDTSGGGRDSRLNRKVGKTAKDLGTYTLIPSLMVAGPVVGYFLGRGIENVFGGEPWGAVVGMLLGVVAAFREVFLLLQRKGNKSTTP